MRIGTGEGFRVGKVELHVTAPHAEGGQLTHDDVAGEHSDLRDLRPPLCDWSGCDGYLPAARYQVRRAPGPRSADDRASAAIGRAINCFACDNIK